MLTLTIGVTGIVCSLPIGILLALGRQSNLPIIKYFCIGFIEFIRGVPLITLLFVASTMLSYFLPPGTTFDLLMRVLIMVTLFSSAYITMRHPSFFVCSVVPGIPCHAPPYFFVFVLPCLHYPASLRLFLFSLMSPAYITIMFFC